MIRRSHIAVVERNVWWRGDFEVEPYEVGWASEAVGFLHVLETEGERSRDRPARADFVGRDPLGRSRRRYARPGRCRCTFCQRCALWQLVARRWTYNRRTESDFFVGSEVACDANHDGD